MDKNNFYKINGVVFAKPVRTANGKVGTKNEGKVFEFPSIILEVDENTKEQNISNFLNLNSVKV